METLYNLVLGSTFEETITKLLILLVCVETVGVIVGGLGNAIRER